MSVSEVDSSERGEPLPDRELKRLIDEKLDEYRPERVDERERGWRDPIYELAEEKMSDSWRQRQAKALVDRREAEATKRANRVFRAYQRGEAPFSFAMLGPLPLVVPKYVVLRDENDEAVFDENGHKTLVRDGNERVRIDVSRTQDFEASADEDAHVGKKRFDADLEVADGKREIARRARAQNLEFPAQLGDLQPRPMKAPERPMGDELPLDYDRDDD